MLTSTVSFAVTSYATEPYRIRAVLSVTGAASFPDNPEKNTIIMRQEQINKAGT